MRRADRLFQIVQQFRGRRLVTARQLSEKLEVSERTIYRDIADLQTNGVPIDGEAGVGYLMRDGFDLPPLMFNRDEIVALVVGARLVKAWGGQAMAEAAQEALVKIESVLPEKDKSVLENVAIEALALNMSETVRQRLDQLNQAIDQRRRLHMRYEDVSAQRSERPIRPLGLAFWGRVWTLIAWCELRDDFRMFRVDRIGMITETGEAFSHERGKTLDDFNARIPSLPS